MTMVPAGPASGYQHTSDPSAVTGFLRRQPGFFGLDHASHQRAITLIVHLCQQAHNQGHRLMLSAKSGRPRLWLQIGPHRRTITITTAAAISKRALPWSGTAAIAYPQDILAVVVTHNRWRHHAWTEDDRSLALQAADIIGQVDVIIKRDQRWLAE